MTARQWSVLFCSINIFLTGFYIPIFAKSSLYAFQENFMAYLGAGIPFMILGGVCFAILIKGTLSRAQIVRRVSGILMPYLFFVYKDYQLFDPKGHVGPTAGIGYFLLVVSMIPLLYLLGFGIAFIVQDSKEREKMD